MKIWEADYEGNSITIINRAFSESLYVNGDLQDETVGLRTHTRLYGELPDGSGIKVSLGGVWSITCRLFVNNELVTTIKNCNKIK